VALLAALHRAIVLLHRGRPRSAAAAIEAVHPVAGDLLGASAAALLAVCRATVGDAAGAAADLARAEAWRRPGSIYDPFLDGARIWTRIAEAQPEVARRVAVEGLDAALEAGRWGQALSLAHIVARIGGSDAAVAASERIGGRVDGPYAAARHAHIAAMASDDPDALASVAASFARIGAELLAAEAGIDAARSARRHGERRRATRLLREAAERAARCEGAATPGLVIPDDELTPLSRREREIADLATRGLSSEEIAGRLFLSVRTVDNHLGHVYQKLGIGSRAELTAALGRQRADGGPPADGGSPDRGP
jgi:DNA-binding CsgD family transcriptional regulator